MQIRRIKPGDREQILHYLLEYPYKELQRRAQALDKDKVSDYHCRRIMRLAKQNDSFLAIDKKSGIIGLTILQPRPWHSEVFGLKMCKLASFLLYRGTRELKEQFIKYVLMKTQSKGYKHIELRVDVNEWENVGLLEARGFRFVDSSLKMYLNLETAHLCLPRVPDKSFKIVERVESYVEQLKEIARSAHMYNHFFADISLSFDKTQELFAQWIEKCSRELACKVLVATRRERAVGFATVLVNQEFNQLMQRKIAILDFIAVHPDFQGRGVGRWLLNETLLRLRRDDDFEQVELRTSITN
ncbi:GNAT family N-acetyltransferase [Candidatus Sumerlaeota bacterium]|nr:GNAT family N-acetyltransferase [Candidatus Sumerlaeota bacterium]